MKSANLLKKKENKINEMLSIELVNNLKEELKKIMKKIEHMKSYPNIIKIKGSTMANPYFVLKKLIEKLDYINNEYDLIRFFTISVLFFCGLRATEFSKLKKSDFNFINKTLAVYTLKQRKKSYDYIPLDHVPTSLLELWQKVILNFEENKLFKNRFTILHRVKEFFNDKNIKAHSLRHALGLLLYETTKDIRLTAQILRHINIANTLIYTKLSNDELKEKLKKLKE